MSKKLNNPRRTNEPSDPLQTSSTPPPMGGGLIPEESSLVDGRPVLKVPVEFQSVSFGKNAASVGIKIPRLHLTDEKVNQFFIGCCLDITMAVDTEAADDDPSQELLIETASVKLSGIAEVHRVSLGIDDITTRLSFPKADIDAAELVKFSNQPGFIIVAKIGEASEAPSQEEGENPDDE